MHTNEFTTPDRKYLIQSHGNGWAYRITENRTGGKSFWVQDADADAVRESTENFEHTDALDDYMDVIGGEE